MKSHGELKRLLDGERLPALLVDLDAFDRNLDRVLASVPHALPIRIATKSLRVPRLIGRLLERSGGRLRGLMCFSVEEAAFLAGEGFDDLFVAYPPAQKSDLDLAADLASRGITLRLAFDDVAHLERFSEAARAKDVRLRTVLCLDMSLRLGPIHLGVRRSPIASVEDALALSRAAKKTPHVVVDGVMGYEAQVAGLPDDRPDDLARWGKRAVRRASVGVARRRRGEIVAALRGEGHDIVLVNGGGTGSLDSTTRDPIVTEVTCGSAFFKPHLFDGFTNASVQKLEPSCFFALEVTRIPARGFATCLGGGYVASGAAGSASLPRPWLPAGLSLLDAEGAGEVQTPLRVPQDVDLRIGDPILFRHAKAGEPCERFREALFVAGGKIVDRAPTYRGMNRTFF